MSREVHINATYRGHKRIIIAKISELLSKVAKDFNIKEDEIEFYDVDSNQISVKNLKSFMSVEVRTKNSSTSASTEATNQYASIIQKLTENTSLTGAERKIVVGILSSNPSLNTDNIKVTRHVKLQVDSKNLISVKTIECQTDSTFTETSAKRSAETINDAMYQSKRLASTEKIDAAKAKVLNDKLYSERREFIYKKVPLVIHVKEKYPLLFSLAEVRNEIDRIFYVGKCEKFLANIERYSQHVLSSVRESDPLLKLTKRKIESASTLAEKKYALQVGSILMISSIVHEERGYLKLIDKHIEPTSLPYIDADATLEDIFSNNHSFRIFSEDTLICTANDFPEAYLCYVACFFIFFIVYPKDIFNTLFIFERLYLEASETVMVNEHHGSQVLKMLKLMVENEKWIRVKDFLSL